MSSPRVGNPRVGVSASCPVTVPTRDSEGLVNPPVPVICALCEVMYMMVQGRRRCRATGTARVRWSTATSSARTGRRACLRPSSATAALTARTPATRLRDVATRAPGTAPASANERRSDLAVARVTSACVWTRATIAPALVFARSFMRLPSAAGSCIVFLTPFVSL